MLKLFSGIAKCVCVGEMIETGSGKTAAFY